MRPRLDKLWKFIEENLEIDYGYLPESYMMDDKDDVRVDEYIQEVKDDIEGMMEDGLIAEESMQNCIGILKKLDDI